MPPQSPVEQFIFRSSFLCAIFPLLISMCPAEENDSETFEADITKWKIVDKSLFIEKHTSDDPFATAANGFDFAWSVSRDKSRVSVSIHDDFAEYKLPFDATVDLADSKKVAPFQAIKTDDGWITVYNQGEFGSAIYWFNNDGSQRKKISDHAVNDFIVVENRIFAAEGLAHLRSNEGSIIEIKKLNRQWVAQNFMTLPESAEAIGQLPKGDFVIAT